LTLTKTQWTLRKSRSQHCCTMYDAGSLLSIFSLLSLLSPHSSYILSSRQRFRTTHSNRGVFLFSSGTAMDTIPSLTDVSSDFLPLQTTSLELSPGHDQSPIHSLLPAVEGCDTLVDRSYQFPYCTTDLLSSPMLVAEVYTLDSSIAGPDLAANSFQLDEAAESVGSPRAFPTLSGSARLDVDRKPLSHHRSYSAPPAEFLLPNPSSLYWSTTETVNHSPQETGSCHSSPTTDFSYQPEASTEQHFVHPVEATATSHPPSAAITHSTAAPGTVSPPRSALQFSVFGADDCVIQLCSEPTHRRKRARVGRHLVDGESKGQSCHFCNRR